MKFKVDRKLFVNYLGRFMTKGYLTISGSNCYNIVVCMIQCKNGLVTFAGRDKTGVIFCRFVMSCEVIEEGIDVISNMETFLDIAKKMKNNSLEISIDNSQMEFKSGSAKIKYGLGDRVRQEDLESFITDYIVSEEGVRYESDNGPRVYKPWFTISDTNELSALQDYAISKVQSDKYTFTKKDDNLNISVDNSTRNRDYVLSIPATHNDEANFTIRYMPAVLDNIEGITSLYYIVGLPDNSKRFFVHNENIDWLVMNV